MDWPVTESYCEAFAKAFGIRLFMSWREGGFEREMLRDLSATAPVHWLSADGQLVARGGNGLQEAQLCTALDLGRATVGTWETGVALPSTAKVVQLAGLLAVSIDWLFGLSERRAIDSH